MIALGFTDQECSLHLREIARELRCIIERLKPQAIYTHSYEGGHPDHDSAAWAVQTAAGGTPRYEFASYHNGSNSLKTGAFLPGGEHVPHACLLSEADRDLKQRMFGCFQSQGEMLRNFRIGVELVRRAPVYDFSRPPHEGTLFYETQPWRNCGEEWRRRAMCAE
jgi:LmbE family N-acetylglucosaminyl deacetylase